MQKTSYLIAVLCFFSFFSKAQSIERFVIGSTGNYQAAGGYSLSSTTGEAVIPTFTGGSYMLTQGFQQPDDKSNGINELLPSNVKVSLYPNPTTDMLVLEINGDHPESYSVELTDMLGRRVNVYTTLHQQGGSSNFLIDMHTLPAAMYILHLYAEGGTVNHSFKISKINY